MSGQFWTNLVCMLIVCASGPAGLFAADSKRPMRSDSPSQQTPRSDMTESEVSASVSAAADMMDDAQTEAPMEFRKPNLKTITLGGVQFWGDVAYFHGWHIQRNVFTGHYRLLDAHDVRHAWGTLEECRDRLNEIQQEQNLPSVPARAVVVLHGLGRSDKSVEPLRRHLESTGFYAIGMNYPSLRASVPENADYLRQVIESLEGVEEIHLVGFSMGGIVIRQYLSQHTDDRLGRVVMIGTPNQGAELATMLKDWWAFKTLVGPAGRQLATAPFGLAPQLPAPPCEFGVIAGCRGTDHGYNPLIRGDNDGTVSLATTRLPGARDFLTVPGLHQMLLHTPEVHHATTHFLEHGQFQADRDPTPILTAEMPAPSVEAPKGTPKKRPGRSAVDVATQPKSGDKSPMKDMSISNN